MSILRSSFHPSPIAEPVFSRRLFSVLFAILLAILLAAPSFGATVQDAGSGHFSGMVTPKGDHPADAHSVGKLSISLSPVRLVGGDSAEVTIEIAEPAPQGGLAVQLRSSDESIVSLPSIMIIPANETRAIVPVTTSPVDDDTTVTISAVCGDLFAGASIRLGVAAQANPAFALAVNPAAVTITPGHSGLTKITTTISNGYDHVLQLTAVKMPVGVTVTFTPAAIPAPGAGTAKAHITVAKSVTPGSYSLRVKASDGAISRGVTVTLNVPSAGPGAVFQGCWYRQNGHRYQGVDFSVADAGTYPFNAILYFGATCDSNNVADQFGFGTLLNFGAFDYTFWFTDFADQTDMSAFWIVGSDKSKCVNYADAPDC